MACKATHPSLSTEGDTLSHLAWAAMQGAGSALDDPYGTFQPEMFHGSVWVASKPLIFLPICSGRSLHQYKEDRHEEN